MSTPFVRTVREAGPYNSHIPFVGTDILGGPLSTSPHNLQRTAIPGGPFKYMLIMHGFSAKIIFCGYT